MSFLNIDFETRSKADIKKVGAYRYAIDSSTVALCLAYDLGDKTPIQLWKPGQPLPSKLFTEIQNGKNVKAHNAEFEYYIWNIVCTLLYGFPALPIERLHCSAATAAALSMPRSLDNLAKALSAPVKKDEEGKKIMLRLSKPKKPSKKDPSIWDNDPEKFEKLYSYCKNDVLTEKVCSVPMPPLPLSEREVYLLTHKINERGVYCDIELCKTAISFIDKFETELTEKLKTHTNGKVTSAKQAIALKDWLNANGCPVENVQKDTITDALKMPGLSDKVKRVLRIRRELGRSSTSKYNAMLIRAGGDNRLRNTLLYHGANTGRWSGKGIQPQNYPRGTEKDLQGVFNALEFGDYDMFRASFKSPMGALSSALRGMLRAEPGKRFIAADYNAIEARVLFWLSGCKTGVDAFLAVRDNEDVYTDMAEAIYSRGITKADSNERQLGKQAVLGCGYGMGYKKFVETCAGYGMKVSEKLGKKAVETYRGKFIEVPIYWRKVESAAVTAIQLRKPIKYRNLVFYVKDGYLFIQLPSGRRLAYYKPSLKEVMKFGQPRLEIRFMGENSTTRQWQRQSTYGGKLVENITQAVARDLLAEAMIRLEKNNYPIVLSVHDEIISERTIGEGSLEELTNLMSQLPEWAAGCPVASEGYEALRFKKG